MFGHYLGFGCFPLSLLNYVDTPFNHNINILQPKCSCAVYNFLDALCTSAVFRYVTRARFAYVKQCTGKHHQLQVEIIHTWSSYLHKWMAAILHTWPHKVSSCSRLCSCTYMTSGTSQCMTCPTQRHPILHNKLNKAFIDTQYKVNIKIFTGNKFPGRCTYMYAHPR